MGRDDPFQHMFAKQHSQNSIRELPSTTYVHVQCILCVQACRDELGTVPGPRMRDFVSHNALTARGVCLSLSPSPSSLSLPSSLPSSIPSPPPSSLSPYSSYLGRGIQDSLYYFTTDYIHVLRILTLMFLHMNIHKCIHAVKKPHCTYVLVSNNYVVLE